MSYNDDTPSVLSRAEREELARLWLLEQRGLSLEERVRMRALEKACRDGVPPGHETRSPEGRLYTSCPHGRVWGLCGECRAEERAARE